METLPDNVKGIDLGRLAREIVARMAPDALLDAQDIAALWKYSPRYITETLAKRSWFPKPVDLGPRGQPRWLRADISACAEARRAKAKSKPGRPRRGVDLEPVGT